MTKREHGSGSGEEMVYCVEARSTYLSPQESNGIVLDNRWRQVPVSDNHLGLGIENKVFAAEASRWGRFMNYQAALALAHWFLANGRHYCVEVRIVKVRFKHSWSTEEIGVSEPIGTDRERDAVFAERSGQPETVAAVVPGFGESNP